MIYVLGGTGFVGGAFVRHFEASGIECRSISRSEIDYYDRDRFTRFLQDNRPEFLINAAGYTGKPNVDACEIYRADSLMGNASLPGLLRESCESVGIPWGHVSSGCIYTGDKGNQVGFTEVDEPNFSFRTNNCSFYSGCKALGEECLHGAENVYVWRLRIPFNHEDSGRNYISKLLRYDWLLEARNSISHLNDFVEACHACWQQHVPFGIYNVTNGGSITTSEVVEMIKRELQPEQEFKFFESDEQFMEKAANTPRSNCVMDNTKLLQTGIEIPSVHDAIERSLKNWVWEKQLPC